MIPRYFILVLVQQIFRFVKFLERSYFCLENESNRATGCSLVVDCTILLTKAVNDAVVNLSRKSVVSVDLTLVMLIQLWLLFGGLIVFGTLSLV